MIKYNNYKLPHGLEYVGDGFTVRKTALCTGKEALRFMEALCKHFIAHPDPTVVPVYDYQYIGAQANNTHRYSYDMMRLGNLSQTEEQIISQVGDGWHLPPYGHGIAEPTRYFGDRAAISAEQAWKEYPKLMTFLEDLVKANRYFDLHGENIMMDNDGDYRIIDLEGFKNPPLDQPENDWITR